MSKDQRTSKKSTSNGRSVKAARSSKEEGNGQPQFSTTELKVFDHFRRYLMTPGAMLCLSAQEIESMSSGLNALVDRKMLELEGTRGAYCLTRSGFLAMRSVAEV